MFLLYLYKEEAIKIYQNFLAKDLKGMSIGIGMSIKQKARIKT